MILCSCIHTGRQGVLATGFLPGINPQCLPFRTDTAVGADNINTGGFDAGSDVILCYITGRCEYCGFICGKIRNLHTAPDRSIRTTGGGRNMKLDCLI